MVTSQPLQRAGRGEGALPKEKEQGRGEVITTETFGGEWAESVIRRTKRKSGDQHAVAP